MTTRSMSGMTRAFSSTWMISGLPPSSRNCLGNGRPMRLPMPPASTIIPIFMRSSWRIAFAPLRTVAARMACGHSLRGTVGPLAPVSSGPGRRSPRRPIAQPSRVRGALDARWHSRSRDRHRSIRWERVQLIVEVASTPETTVDPERLRLRRPAGRGAFAPTRGTVAGDRLTIHYNVITGLDRGSLAAGPLGARAPVALADPTAVGETARTSAGSFLLERGCSRSTPALRCRQRDLLAGGVRSIRAIQRSVDLSIADHVRLAGRWAVHPTRAGSASWPLIWCVAADPPRRPPEVLFASALISEMSGNLKAVHDRMVERGLDRDYDLVTALRPRSRRAAGLARPGAAGAGAIDRADGDPARRLLPAAALAEARAEGPDHPAVACRRGVQDGRLQPGRHADRRGPVRPGPQARTPPRSSAPSTTSRSMPRRSASPRIGSSRPASRGWTASSTSGPEPPAWPPLAQAFPQRDGQVHHPVRPDVPWPGPQERDVRLRPARLCRAPRARRREGRAGHHQDASVRPPAAWPSRNRCATGCIDGSKATHRRQRPAVRGRPAHHRLLVDRLRVLDPRPADALLRLRPRRVRRRRATSTSRSRRSCRVGSCGRSAELVDAIRRDDYQVEKVAQFAARHFAHLDARSSDRVIDQLVIAPMKGLILTIRIARRSASRSRWLAMLPLRSRVVLATAHAARLGGNLVSIRDDLAAPPPGGPGRRPRPPAGSRGVRGRIAALGQADRPRATTWPPRASSSSTTTSSRSTSSARATARRSSRPGMPAAPSRRSATACSTSRSGRTRTLTRRVRHPLELRRLPGRLGGVGAALRRGVRPAARAVQSRLGIPRTDVFFGEERLARTRAAVRRRYGAARRSPGDPLRADLPRRHHHLRPRDRRPRHPAALTAVLGEDHVLLVRLHPFVRVADDRSARTSRTSRSTSPTTRTSTS